ncbi:DUF938 domain-containing protein [Roseovarius sp. 2305UL8-3]|uniref:DUF938 domain-containing protein n=1 Tax=Roseovarius conchicola TaxID=3121636 RepID=UPI0035285D0B
MSYRKTLPQNASVFTPDDQGRLFAPAAERNAEAITALLQHHAPATGTALEIASGTGQHVAAFAAALPDLVWQPSEVDKARRDSIGSWVQNAANVRAVIALDATDPGWSAVHHGYDLILNVNLLHLISTPEAQTLITEAAQALAPGGRLILYGPFLRDGEATSEGDSRFHASLCESDPEIGYKDDFDVIDWLHEAGLELMDVVEMPANNLSFVAKKAG